MDTIITNHKIEFHLFLTNICSWLLKNNVSSQWVFGQGAIRRPSMRRAAGISAFTATIHLTFEHWRAQKHSGSVYKYKKMGMAIMAFQKVQKNDEPNIHCLFHCSSQSSIFVSFTLFMVFYSTTVFNQVKIIINKSQKLLSTNCWLFS